jgi:hypothetical protein
MKLSCAFLVGFIVMIVGCAQAPGSAQQKLLDQGRESSPEWIYTEPVRYQENHDPSVIWLEDGRQLAVQFGTITWEQVEKGWRAGRQLTLAYSARQGCVLIDEETRDLLPVIGGWGDEHPLDVILRKNLALTQSTIDMIEAYRSNALRWEKEIERLYRLYLESERTTSEQRRTIMAERAAWLKYREAHDAFAGSLVTRSNGTMWTIRGMEHDHALCRDQAHHLQALLEVLAASDPVAGGGGP